MTFLENMPMRPRTNLPRTCGAFTLVELLVVIAIIAILAAIIFPVFATVRENARQSSSISNMRQISTAMGQFQLDNHRNPDVLFGYVYYQYSDSNGDINYSGTGKTPLSIDAAFSQAQTDAQAHPNAGVTSTFFPGLYPEYVRDVAAFRDADNNDNGNVPSKIANIDVTLNGTALNGNTPTNVLCPSTDTACTATTPDGTLVKTTRRFYAEDAYDVSPQVTSTNQVNKDLYVARYQSAWTNIDKTLNDACTTTPTPITCNGNSTSSTNFYTHQLHWKNPPAETYVTSTTYHVQNTDTVLVLFEGGNAKKLNTKQFQQYGADASSVAVTNASGTNVSPANFWKLTPAGR